MNLFIVTIPLELYILLYFILDPGLLYVDLGLWLIIIFSFFGLAIFGSFIPISHRAWSLTSLGFIIFINSLLLFLIGSISIFTAGFWLLIGILCFYISYISVEKKFEELVLGIEIGIGIGILAACVAFASQYDFESTRYNYMLILGILVLWVIIAIFMLALSIRDRNAMEKVLKTVKGLYTSIPIYIGIILIFFGIFLMIFEKLIETIVELFLGGIVIVYGAKQLIDQSKTSVVLIGLIALAITVTLAVILLG